MIERENRTDVGDNVVLHCYFVGSPNNVSIKSGPENTTANDLKKSNGENRQRRQYLNSYVIFKCMNVRSRTRFKVSSSLQHGFHGWHRFVGIANVRSANIHYQALRHRFLVLDKISTCGSLYWWSWSSKICTSQNPSHLAKLAQNGVELFCCRFSIPTNLSIWSVFVSTGARRSSYNNWHSAFLPNFRGRRTLPDAIRFHALDFSSSLAYHPIDFVQKIEVFLCQTSGWWGSFSIHLLCKKLWPHLMCSIRSLEWANKLDSCAFHNGWLAVGYDLMETNIQEVVNVKWPTKHQSPYSL